MAHEYRLDSGRRLGACTNGGAAQPYQWPVQLRGESLRFAVGSTGDVDQYAAVHHLKALQRLRLCDSAGRRGQLRRRHELHCLQAVYAQPLAQLTRTRAGAGVEAADHTYTRARRLPGVWSQVPTSWSTPCFSRLRSARGSPSVPPVGSS